MKKKKTIMNNENYPLTNPPILIKNGGVKGIKLCIGIRGGDYVHTSKCSTEGKGGRGFFLGGQGFFLKEGWLASYFLTVTLSLSLSLLVSFMYVCTYVRKYYT